MREELLNGSAAWLTRAVSFTRPKASTVKTLQLYLVQIKVLHAIESQIDEQSADPVVDLDLLSRPRMNRMGSTCKAISTP